MAGVESDYQEEQIEEEGGALCMGCLHPVDPLAHYCEACGATVGQFTEYLPFEGIKWEAFFYDRLRTVAFSREGGTFRKVCAMVLTVFFAPFILLGQQFSFFRKNDTGGAEK